MVLGLLLVLLLALPSLPAPARELQLFVHANCPPLQPGQGVSAQPAAAAAGAAGAAAGIQAPGVPTFLFEGELLVGFDGPEGRGRELLALIERQVRSPGVVRLGPLDTLELDRLGLPLFTLVLGLLDGFNPCAMWVLLFLLSLLVHSRDRRRMALVAGTFVLVSGLVYFAFLTAWLNVFLVLGWSTPLLLLLGALALAVGVVNLREFWRHGSAFTLSIPAGAKPGLYARMRGVMVALALILLLRPHWLL